MEKETIKDAKLSPTFSADIFAREYCSKWTGTIEGALFNLDKLTALRKLKRPEFKPNTNGNPKVFYVLSVDVGRKRDKSAFEIFKVIPKEDHFEKHLVNILIFHKMSLQAQARKIREMDETFNFEIIAVDANGLGIGLIDHLVEDFNDQVNEKTYTGYNIINIDEHKDYKSYQSPTKPTKLYPIITNQHNAGKLKLARIHLFPLMVGVV